MRVGRILSYDEAVEFYGNDDFYEADECVVDGPGSSSPLNLHRQLSRRLAKQLRFASKAGPKGLFFRPDGRPDNQATRGVRELTPESATLLDRIIAITDRSPPSGELVMVTEKKVREGTPPAADGEFQLPDEVPSGGTYPEGAVRRFW